MNIDEIIAGMNAAKEEKASAEKREKFYKALLLDYAGGRACFETDVFMVTIKTTTSTRLDTTALYNDFPDIKREYGKTTESKSVTAVCKDDALKSA